MALKGLSFLETGQGEVRGKVPPPCPALLECGAGMAIRIVSLSWMLLMQVAPPARSGSELGHPS